MKRLKIALFFPFALISLPAFALCPQGSRPVPAGTLVKIDGKSAKVIEACGNQQSHEVILVSGQVSYEEIYSGVRAIESDRPLGQRTDSFSEESLAHEDVVKKGPVTQVGSNWDIQSPAALRVKWTATVQNAHLNGPATATYSAYGDGGKNPIITANLKNGQFDGPFKSSFPLLPANITLKKTDESLIGSDQRIITKDLTYQNGLVQNGHYEIRDATNASSVIETGTFQRGSLISQWKKNGKIEAFSCAERFEYDASGSCTTDGGKSIASLAKAYQDMNTTLAKPANEETYVQVQLDTEKNCLSTKPKKVTGESNSDFSETDANEVYTILSKLREAKASAAEVCKTLMTRPRATVIAKFGGVQKANFCNNP